MTAVRGGQLVYSADVGVRDTSTGQRVDAGTVFQLASLSEPIGAAVVGSVVSDTDLQWTTELSEYLPGFALADPYPTKNVQLADTYSHRSGLPGHAGDDFEEMLGIVQPLTNGRAKHISPRIWNANAYFGDAKIMEKDGSSSMSEETRVPILLIMGYEVTNAPGRVIDEKVVGFGRVPAPTQVRDFVMAQRPGHSVEQNGKASSTAEVRMCGRKGASRVPSHLDLGS